LYKIRNNSKSINSLQEEGSERGFVKFVLEPIYKVHNATMEGNKEEIAKLLEKLDIKLTSAEKELEGKELMTVNK
jgi:elongation factor 2